MSLDPKVLVQFEVKERGKETFILRADFDDFEYNSFGAHLLSFNIEDKISKFDLYVDEVMGSDNALKAIEGLDKMIYEDKRLAVHLKLYFIERLVKILQESGRLVETLQVQESDSVVSRQHSAFIMHSAFILSHANIDTYGSIIRDKAIPALVHLLHIKSSFIDLPVVFTLSRFASVSPDYVSVILDQGALEYMYDIAVRMDKGTRLMENLAKFMAVICRVKILTHEECRQCITILDKIFLWRVGFYVHMARACYALQFLSYERHVEIQQGTINHVTQLSCNRDNMVAGSALGVLGNIARWGNSDQIEILAKDADVLRCLQMSLSDSKPMMFQWEVCQIITKIADKSPTFAQLAKEEFRSRIRKLVGEIESACVDTFKLRTTDWQTGQPLVIEKLNQILEFNALLIALKNCPDTSRFAGDLKSVSFLVGDMRKADLEILYGIYATYSLSSGRIEEDKLAALNQLGSIFGLGTKKTESIKFAVTSNVYRKRVAQSIISGRLEAAKSRTDFLQNLCKELKFNAQEASKIHEELCRQVQKQPLFYRKSSEDVQSLERIRNMLSVTKPISELEHPDNMQL